VENSWSSFFYPSNFRILHENGVIGNNIDQTLTKLLRIDKQTI